MPDRVRLRDSLIPETARLICDQQSLRWGLTLRPRHTPQLSRSDLVLWHQPAVVRDQPYARYGRELRTDRRPLVAEADSTIT